MFLNTSCVGVLNSPTHYAINTPATYSLPITEAAPDDTINKTMSCISDQNQPESRSGLNNSTAVIVVLGIILSLCVVLLLLVTAGWVYTCRALKTLKRTHDQRLEKNHTEEEQR